MFHSVLFEESSIQNELEFWTQQTKGQIDYDHSTADGFHEQVEIQEGEF